MSDRDVSTIEQDLQETRAQLTHTVDELLSSLSPKDNVKRVKADLLGKAHGLLGDAAELLQRAKEGDKSAQKVLSGVAAGVGLAALLLVRKILR